MKKALAFILAIFYLSFSVGATFHKHYCMGELVGTSLFSLKDRKCGKCGMEKHTEESKDCCKDVSIDIKTKDSHTFSHAAIDLPVFNVVVPDFEYSYSAATVSIIPTENTCRAHSPPLLKNPLFIQFGNFRI